MKNKSGIYICKKDVYYKGNLIWIKGKSYNICESNFLSIKYYTFHIEPYVEHGYHDVGVKLLLKSKTFDVFYTDQEIRQLKLKKINEKRTN